MKPSSTESRATRLARHLLPLIGVAAVAAAWAMGGASASAAPSPSGPAPAPAPHAVTLNGARVALPESLHPWARGGSDLGRMDPTRRLTGMSILFKSSPAQKALANQTLLSLQDPTSPSFHRWLTPEQYAAQFGATSADVARVAGWLASHGLTVDGPSRTSTRLAFSGSIADLEATFGTEMHNYEVDGVKHFAMSAAPRIPAELSDVVVGLHGMHDFKIAAPRHARMRPQYGLPVPEEDGGTFNAPTLGPADFAAIYDVGSLYDAGITGGGQHIAVAEQTDFNDADIAAFRSTFKLSTNPPTRHLVPNSGPSQVTDPNDLGEAELDAEWAGAVAPDATIDYVYTGTTDNNGVFDALLYAIEQDYAPLISISYGSCEAGNTPSDAAFIEAMGDSAAMMGITVLAASGDTGAAGCDGQFSKAARHGEFVGLPASIPSIVAVGGTQFQIDEQDAGAYVDQNLNALGYIPEQGWNETATDESVDAGGLGASTGGVSVVFAKPYWQVPFTPKDNFRDVPDVALTTSAAIMPYVTSGSWTAADGTSSPVQAEALTPVGGTSCAAPSFAGILALVNQSLAKAHPNLPVGLGNANPVLYALANNPTGAAAFHDITSGDNIVPCQAASPDCPTTPPLQFGYTAGKGYDQVTGLGSVDVAKLASVWAAMTPTATTLTATPSGTTEGATLQLDATVASTATATGLTGSVTFYFETFDTDGGIDLGGTLGTVAITPTTSGNEGGTASLKTTAPSGLTGASKVGAFYGGDANYLASWSTLAAVVAKPTLTICPTAVTLTPGQTGFVFQTIGGVPPVTFSTGGDDSTCTRVNHVEVCSSFGDGGVFTAGPAAGTVTIIALDQAQAYATATVTVAGDADSGTPLPVVSCGGTDGGVSDAGSGATVMDASSAPIDAAVVDGGGTSPPPPPPSSGCGCVVAGGTGGMGAGWVGTLFGLAAFVSRRRRRS